MQDDDAISEILSTCTYVAGHVLLLNSLDLRNTGIPFIFLTVLKFVTLVYDERISPIPFEITTLYLLVQIFTIRCRHVSR